MWFVKITYNMRVYYYLGIYYTSRYTRDFVKYSRRVTRRYYLTENMLEISVKVRRRLTCVYILISLKR